MQSDFRLSDLKQGQKAAVKELRSSRAMRRRLMDLGLTPGTIVECLGNSPFGDPRSFLIRGAVIALRERDCCDISITAPGDPCFTEKKYQGGDLFGTDT